MVFSQGQLSLLPSSVWVMLFPVTCVLKGCLWMQPSQKLPQREGTQPCSHMDTTLPGTWNIFSVLQDEWSGSSAHGAWWGHLSPLKFSSDLSARCFWHLAAWVWLLRHRARDGQGLNCQGKACDVKNHHRNTEGISQPRGYFGHFTVRVM